MSLSKFFYEDYINNNLNQWATISADLEETSKSDSLEKNKKLLTRVTECISRISTTSSSKALRKDPQIIGRILSQVEDADIRDKAMMALDRAGRMTFFSFILRLERIQSSQPLAFQSKHVQEEKEELEDEEVTSLSNDQKPASVCEREEIFSFDGEEVNKELLDLPQKSARDYIGYIRGYSNELIQEELTKRQFDDGDIEIFENMSPDSGSYAICDPSSISAGEELLCSIRHNIEQRRLLLNNSSI